MSDLDDLRHRPDESVIHQCPPVGSGVTPRCGRTPFDLPLTDRLTIDGSVTCGPSPNPSPSTPGDDT